MSANAVPRNDFAPGGPLSPRRKAWGLVLKYPEVVVNLDIARGGQGGGEPICTVSKAIESGEYIARNGKLAVEDEQGFLIADREAVRDTIRDWGVEDTQRLRDDRVAQRIIVSAGRISDRADFERAVEEWGRETFRGHPFILGFHYDTDHPHAHFLIRGRSLETDRQFSVQGPEEMQRLRESLADKMQDRGIEANATRRYTHGISGQFRPGRGEYHLVARMHEPAKKFGKLVERLDVEALESIRTGKPQQKHPSDDVKVNTRRQVKAYAAAFCAELRETGDRKDGELADRLERYYEKLYLLGTMREERRAVQLQRLKEEEARREAERKERERKEAERRELARKEAERRKQEEARRRAQEEAKRREQAQKEAERRAQEEAKRRELAQKEAKRRAQEEARRREEAQNAAERRAQEEARLLEQERMEAEWAEQERLRELDRGRDIEMDL